MKYQWLNTILICIYHCFVFVFLNLEKMMSIEGTGSFIEIIKTEMAQKNTIASFCYYIILFMDEFICVSWFCIPWKSIFLYVLLCACKYLQIFWHLYLYYMILRYLCTSKFLCILVFMYMYVCLNLFSFVWMICFILV